MRRKNVARGRIDNTRAIQDMDSYRKKLREYDQEIERLRRIMNTGLLNKETTKEHIKDTFKMKNNLEDKYNKRMTKLRKEDLADRAKHSNIADIDKALGSVNHSIKEAQDAFRICKEEGNLKSARRVQEIITGLNKRKKDLLSLKVIAK